MKLSLLSVFLLACGGAPFETGSAFDGDAGPPPEAAQTSHDAAGADVVSPPDAIAQEAGDPPHDAAPPIDAPVDEPPSCPVSTVDFTCPAGGLPAGVQIPSYYALTDVDQCSLQKTPAACACSVSYDSACLKAAGVCGAQSFSGYTASSGVIVVSCD